MSPTLKDLLMVAERYQDLLRTAERARHQANRDNLYSGNSGAYVTGAQRSDLYLWFYEEAIRAKHEVRWPLAASYVSKGVGELADLGWWWEGLAGLTGNASNETQALVRHANQVILENVLPKLAALLPRPAVRGRAAVEWDMGILIEEQYLAQPLYEAADGEVVAQVAAAAQQGLMVQFGAFRPFGPNANEVTAGLGRRPTDLPKFRGDILDPADRWRYGMEMAAAISTITPLENGQPVPVPADPPPPDPGYLDGTELAKVDTRPHLHRFEAITDSLLNTDEQMLIDDVMATFTQSEQRIFLAEPRFVARLVDSGATFRTFVEGIKHFGVDLEAQLRAIGDYPGGSWRDVWYEADVQPMIRRAPPEQRSRIRGDAWKSVFVDVCTNATMPLAVADLGLDATEAQAWIAAEN